MTTSERIIQIFDLLDDWRELPAYQLERRADIFFALYLPEILNQCLELGNEITPLNIIPEFPIKKKDNNRSNKIDYVAVSLKKKTIYLIELKTDQNSFRDKQNKYLEVAKNKNETKSLIDDFNKISRASKAVAKYMNLKHLMDASGLNHDSDIFERKIIYILPKMIDNIECDKIILFDDIIKILNKKEEDAIAKRFVKSLEKWKISN